jgi:hypothetical protein
METSMLWIPVLGIIILLTLLYAVLERHSSRSVLNAVLTFFGMVTLYSLSAISLHYTSLYLSALLEEVIPFNYNFLSTLVLISVFAAGLWLTVHSIRSKPPQRLVVQRDKAKIDLVRLCRALVLAFFVTIPSVTYLTLMANYDSYSANRLAETGASIGVAFEIVWTQFHVLFATMFWWPFIIAALVLSGIVLKRNMTRPSAMLLILSTMVSFCLPYVIMMIVLAFDVMEMDFPAVAHVYYMYFLWLAPGLGAILASIWVLGIYLLLGRRVEG